MIMFRQCIAQVKNGQILIQVISTTVVSHLKYWYDVRLSPKTKVCFALFYIPYIYCKWRNFVG